jgi:hypothetical protein
MQNGHREEFVNQLRNNLLSHIRDLDKNWTSKEWSRFARQIYRFQSVENLTFLRWIKKWTGRQPTIQGLPIIAFKESKVCSFKPTSRISYFESSGTTKSSKPSRHYFRSLDLYEASVIAGWERRGRVQCSKFDVQRSEKINANREILGRVQERKQKPTLNLELGTRNSPRTENFVGVMPSSLEAPHSSLSKMVAILMKRFGDGDEFWCMKEGRWDWTGFRRHLQKMEKSFVLFGTAFGWVHFIDWCQKRRFKFDLPPKTLVLETGGYKGKSRELTRMELYSALQKLLGKNVQIQSEYSMCELSSQAYSFPYPPRESQVALRRDKTASPKTHLFNFPPWCHYRVICPLTSKETKRGEVGVLEIYDLANLDSCAFIRTEDMVIDHGNGFELLGRLPRAGLKGCSLTFE